jgi:choline transport protein
MQGKYFPLCFYTSPLTIPGWITLFAWICSCASNPALIVNIIIGLASFNYPEYEAKRWHVTLLMWAITIAPFIGNFWFRKFLSPLEALGAILHVTFFTTSLITLVVTARRSSTDYVFNTLTSGVSGWNNPAASWGIGLLTVTYPLTGFDGVLHMSDEVKKARVRVPRSMVTSVVMNAVMQFAYLIAVLFCIGDVDVTSSAVLPITQVFYQATGSKAVTNLFVAMMGVIIFIAFFNVFASDSRLVWAFSRDKGLPFSHIFAKVHPTLKMPLNALLLIGACIFILALINIGSSTAFNALISLPALGLYVSYFFPILFLFIRRFSRSHPTPIPWGPFKLGMWGAPVNFAAMCYIIFVVIWMPMPTTLPVTKDNFNYAGPILGGVILLAALDWCISGRKRFQVPIAHHRPDDD